MCWQVQKGTDPCCYVRQVPTVHWAVNTRHVCVRGTKEIVANKRVNCVHIIVREAKCLFRNLAPCSHDMRDRKRIRYWMPISPYRLWVLWWKATCTRLKCVMTGMMTIQWKTSYKCKLHMPLHLAQVICISNGGHSNVIRSSYLIFSLSRFLAPSFAFEITNAPWPLSLVMCSPLPLDALVLTKQRALPLLRLGLS